VSSNKSNQWAMALHLSVFAGYAIPFAGLVAPIIIWQVKKEQMPEIEVHGRIVCNWILSFLIYMAISIALWLIGIGFFITWFLGLLALIYPIIGAVKASNGEAWPYPGSIRFFG